MGILTLLWVVTLAVAWTIAFLVVGAEARVNTFYLSMAGLSLGLTLVFMHPILMLKAGMKGSSSLPIQFGIGLVLFAYLAGTIGLLLVAAFGALGFTTLVALHLGLFLAMILVFGLSGMASGNARAMAERDKAARSFLTGFRFRFRGLADRLGVMKAEGLGQVKSRFATMRDEVLGFADPDSLPGSEEIEQELNACLGGLEQLVAELESGGDAAEVGPRLLRELERMKLQVELRNQLLKELR